MQEPSPAHASSPASSGAIPPTLTEDGFLNGRLRILQPEKGYRAGIDAVFLAASVPCAPGDKVFEAGMGTGVAALCLAHRVPGVQITGVEVAARYAMLAEENARRNECGAGVKVIHADIKDALRRDVAHMPAAGSFAHAFANPPYFEDGRSTPSPVALKAGAHNFSPEDLDLWIKAMHAMLESKGTATLIYRAEALSKVLSLFEGRFGDIVIAPLFPRHGLAATRIIVQGVKGSRAPVQLLPGLVLHGDDGKFSSVAEAVLREGAAWPVR
ncbi:tRNA1(Val) (adenine(37)-N6)-methyltransferase [Aestuariivirga sp. YIM B02566]|uniref:Methyltransferase n=1 Tax=Taklimakanibacter albus TaxID=2800327 RepID=A0ACC5RCM0_9HYPH|nr:methyltransferase [Aestuariivirga sp. YIM B02566]MBK1870382.1 methyltransferase [Aestuariivirga sp. YIM B02566]